MKLRETAFVYAVAKVKALLARQLNQDFFRRIIDAENASELLKLLQENGYQGETAEEMLENEMKKTYDFLWDISPVKSPISLFALRQDYHNIKVLLKAEFLGQNYDFLLRTDGRYSPEILQKAFAEKDFSALTEPMKKAIQEGKAALRQTENPQKTESILDRAAFGEMLALAKETENPLVQKLVVTMIDLSNLQTFLRVKSRGQSAELLHSAILPGGTIHPELLVQGLGRPAQEVILQTAYKDLAEFSEDWAAFHKRKQAYIDAILQKAKYESFGVAPLLAYLFVKEREVALLRRVIKEKNCGVSKEIIRESVSEVYG